MGLTGRFSLFNFGLSKALFIHSFMIMIIGFRLRCLWCFLYAKLVKLLLLLASYFYLVLSKNYSFKCERQNNLNRSNLIQQCVCGVISVLLFVSCCRMHSACWPTRTPGTARSATSWTPFRESRSAPLSTVQY